jgi:hypothetical protein
MSPHAIRDAPVCSHLAFDNPRRIHKMLCVTPSFKNPLLSAASLRVCMRGVGIRRSMLDEKTFFGSRSRMTGTTSVLATSAGQ